MHDIPILTDRTALDRNRSRASAMETPTTFLQEEAILEIQERLKQVNRTFTDPVIVTGFGDLWREIVPNAGIVADTEILDLKPGAHDLVIHAMGLHWANDPVGQLAQALQSLRPDGLFLAILFGGNTLTQLRDSLARAEVSVTGGLSPRIAPMGELRDLGGLLQRAGFALPVADSTITNVTYETAFHLMRDLRAMGEANALADRNRRPLRRAVLAQAAMNYHETYGQDGRIPATFEMIVLTGWAPAENQQKPLRPGSAISRLADALGTDESSV
ncbi:MAG: class I SAM-dependent methyltransferase [Marinosulfonomonas sp.]